MAGVALLLLSGCGTNLPAESADGRHLGSDPATTATADNSIPDIVSPVPLVGPPEPQVEPELYTVVAQDIPVRDLLFTMARDAGINVDVHPAVSGQISINAIDQTLPQILERIARQVSVRWRFDASGNLVVEPDSPFWKTYRVDYVNVARISETEAEISTAIVSTAGGQGGAGGAGGGAGGLNTSTASMNQTTANNFWVTLAANLNSLLTQNGTDAADTQDLIVANPESGVVSVRATTLQHEEIANFINNVQARSLYQVLIEATVVEVRLSDNYQSGVDWATIGRNGGEISFDQNLIGGNLGSAPVNVLTIDRSNTPDAINATIRLLSQFGELRVLSSPKIMTLNNQTAMLRVVDNFVYFNVEVEPPVISATGPSTGPTYTTNINTVPIGFVMTVTPQISENDQITLNVRPTISRIVDFARDPNPILAEADITNDIPVIQVREFESLLKVYDGQIAILGGLMEDSLDNSTDGIPGLSRVPGLRNLFSFRNDRMLKTELIIFIRPVVIRQPSLQGDLSEYRSYLPTNGVQATEPRMPQGLFSGQRSE